MADEAARDELTDVARLELVRLRFLALFDRMDVVEDTFHPMAQSQVVEIAKLLGIDEGLIPTDGRNFRRGSQL